MSGLKIGLVSPASDESVQLASLLAECGSEVVHNITPDQINDQHVADESLHVWLLSVDDDSWHDAIDHLLDESEIPVYFNEPGTLSKQSHPQFWCSNLLNRLYEMSGLDQEPEAPAAANEAEPAPAEPATVTAESPQPEVEETEEISLEAELEDMTLEMSASETLESDTPLSQSLDDLEMSAKDLPKDIAAELVSELESISPVLNEDIIESANESNEPDSLDELEIGDIEATTGNSENSEDALELDDFSLELDAQIEDVDPIKADTGETTTPLAEDEEDATFLGLEPEVSIEDETDSIDDMSLALDNAILSVDEDSDLSDEPIEDEEFGSFALELDDTVDDLSLEVESAATEVPQASAETPPEVDLDSAIGGLELEALDDSSDDESQVEFDLPEPEIDEPDVDVESELNTGDLELEALDQPEESPQGKAQFAIDDSDLLPAEETVEATETTAETEEESEEPGGLTLEAMDDDESPVTGKANFLEEEAEEEIKLPEPEEVVEEEDNGLTLEAMEESAEPDWLNAESDVENTLGQDVEQLDSSPAQESEIDSVEEQEFDFELEAMETPMAQDQPDMQHAIEDAAVVTPEEAEVSQETVLEENSVEPALDLSEQEMVDAEISSGIELDEDTIRDIAREALADDPDSEDIDLPTPTLEADFEVPEDLDLDAEVPLVEEVSESVTESTSNETEVLSESVDDSMALENPLEDFDDSPAIEEAFVVDPVEEPTGPDIELPTLEETQSFEIPMLDETAGDIEFEEKTEPSFERRYTPCWVIGASLGGPAAVKRFLNAVPSDINASFIIAQHIDENFLPVLAEILTNSSPFTVTVAQGSNDIEPGKVYLAPLKGKLVFLQDGSMLVDHSQKWSAPYSPCINDVIEAVSSVYGEMSGAIIFSGMGEDGLNGARKMRQSGGQVWAQSTDTCANSSMPESVINNGETDFIGTPEQLATRLASELKSTTSLAG